MLACIFLTAVFFGGWPLIARKGGADAGTMGTLVMATTALLPIIFAFLYQGAPLPTVRSGLWFATAGIVMRMGFITYSAAIANAQEGLSVTVPAISGLVTVMSATGAVCFYRDAFTLQKALGIVLIVMGIYYLRPGQGVSPKPSNTFSTSAASLKE